MKIAVVDDFQKDRDTLAFWIEEYMKEKKVDGTLISYPGGEELLEDFSSGKFQAVFLDIYMNGINGMETARRIRKMDQECLIVFSTSSEQYAVQGYSVQAFHYLLKPCQKEQVWDVMELMNSRLFQGMRYIEVKEERIQKRILVRSIESAELIGHYIWIQTPEQEVKTRMKMQSFLDLLDDRRFLECYRNIVINMDQVEKVDDDSFWMKNGKQVPIQPSRIKQVKQQFSDYMFEKARKGFGGL